MTAYRWRNGPSKGVYVQLSGNDYVVRVARPTPLRAMIDVDPIKPVAIEQVKCRIDHENHEIIWPDDNWRGYWSDNRPMKTYLSYTISDHDYTTKDQIMRDMESDTKRRATLDNVTWYECKWVVYTHNGTEVYPRRWQYVLKQTPMYCDNEIHGPNSIDAWWWCPKDHPQSLFERK